VGSSNIDLQVEEREATSAEPSSRPLGLLHSLGTGAGALGVALGIERGGSFLANVLAARLGGAQVFGAYSIALNAANNVAWYVGAGIGDTSSRFIAGHPRGTRSYHQVVRCLMLIAAVSAGVAASVLFAGAGPMASKLLRNANLTNPLRVAALSSAAFVLLECCRGLFIGTRSFGRLLVLSAMVGIGLPAVVPYAAKLGASHMLGRQSGAVLLAVAVSLVLVFRDRKAPSQAQVREIESPRLGRIWKFGLMQLGGVAGVNAAGWWTASLVARWDVSLVQVAFYVVATQWRNIASLVPSLMTHGNFAFFTDEGSEHFGGADRVITVSSFAACILSTLCSGVMVAVLPWVLVAFYGKDYINAELPSALAVATLLVHMTISPAAARLMIISPLSAGIINGIWAVFVAGMGTLLIPHGGATAATATLFLAHMLSTFLTVGVLWRMRRLPAGVTMLMALETAMALVTIGLAALRTVYPQYSIALSLLLVAITAATAMVLFRLGQAHGAFPKTLSLVDLLRGGWRQRSATPEYGSR